MDDLDNIIKESEIAIDELKGPDAKKLLKKLEQFVAGQNIESNDQVLYQQLKKLQIKLKIVAFPSLSDEESTDVLRHHYLESFDADISMEDQLTVKLFSIPYLVRDDLRKVLKKATLENNQKVGSLTIGQWLQEFNRAFSENTRDNSAIVQFILQHPQARTLKEAEKAKLKKIFHTYDYLLISTLPATGPILEELLKSIPDEEVYAQRQSVSAGTPYYAQAPGFSDVGTRMQPAMRSSVPAGRRTFASGPIVKMSLNEALQKFENLGEQLVTSSPLKLKILPAPVRPSIKNWIMDYHQVLGAGAHQTMDRGNYLYHSENGKRLTSGERQKLAVVLKSLDENELLAVDSGKQEVSFGNYESGIRNYESDKKEPSVKITRQISDSMSPYSPTLSPGGPSASEARRGWSEKPGEGSNVRFSAPQKFPVERKDLGYQPYKISPVSYSKQVPSDENGRSEPKISGNIVDLKNM